MAYWASSSITGIPTQPGTDNYVGRQCPAISSHNLYQLRLHSTMLTFLYHCTCVSLYFNGDSLELYTTQNKLSNISIHCRTGPNLIFNCGNNPSYWRNILWWCLSIAMSANSSQYQPISVECIESFLASSYIVSIKQMAWEFHIGDIVHHKNNYPLWPWCSDH